MAPATTSAKALQQNRPRPAAPRTVVPVIPLPYIQKRQQQDAARAKAKEEAAAPPPVVEAPRSSTPPPPAKITPPIANGSSDGQVSEKSEDAIEPASPSVAASPSAPVTEEYKPAPEEPEVTVEVETSRETQETPKSAPSESQSSASRSTYQMPPAFVPATQSQTNGNHTVAHNDAFNGQQTMHHTHPSVGNVIFGGFHESARSSPAPHPHPLPYSGLASGPASYSYTPQLSNGGHAHHMSNGYNPTVPSVPPGFYPRQGNSNPVADPYARRQMVSFGPPEGYSPSATPMVGDHNRMSFDPSTPHSFHGSQSSVTNEQENGPAFYSQYPTAVISNGSNGHIDEVRLYQPARAKPLSGPQTIPGPGYNNLSTDQFPDQLDGLLWYLQREFGVPDFADYTLELRYTDDRAPPVRIPGHNILLARSPTLKELMIAQARESSNDGQAIRTLLIESDDRYLRSDGFWMAVHRLYGAPLLETGPSNAYASAPPPPCVPTDRFTFALGYASAGKLLQMPPVIQRGVEVASQMINWNNIEVAFDFGLDGGLDHQWSASSRPRRFEDFHSPSTYGPHVNFLIYHALQYLIDNFPARFVLNTSVGDSRYNRRLPTIPQAGQNPRLSSIKFGDHSSEESARSSSENPIIATLSRLLLNLPWDLLKYVLESPNLGNVQGWATAVLRQQVMNTVVEEREKRRVKALETPLVSNEERKANDKEWQVVGWMEKVQLSNIPGKEQIPTIERRWVDFTLLNQD